MRTEKEIKKEIFGSIKSLKSCIKRNLLATARVCLTEIDESLDELKKEIRT